MPSFKNHWPAILLLLLLLLSSQPGYAQWKITGDDCVFPTSKRYFNVVADEKSVSDADLDHPAKTPAKIRLPVLPPHTAEIAQAEQDYDAGRFAEAAAHLKPCISQRIVTPQVLNQYARALYRVPGGKPQSYATY